MLLTGKRYLLALLWPLFRLLFIPWLTHLMSKRKKQPTNPESDAGP